MSITRSPSVSRCSGSLRIRTPSASSALTKPRRHRAIRHHHLVRQIFNRADLRLGQAAAIQVNRHALTAEVKADGVRVGDLHESLRQNVLPGVVLHVIEAPRPIDHAVYVVVRHVTRQQMHYRPILFARRHIDHRHPVDRPQDRWAGRRWSGKNRCGRGSPPGVRPSASARSRRAVELGGIGIVIVQSHHCPIHFYRCL